MPRPKVHPSQRKRAAEACSFCRMSKKKCSATAPCTACQRRGIGHTCYITNSPRAPRSAARQSLSQLSDSSPHNPTARIPNTTRHGSGNEGDWSPSESRTWVPTQITPQDAYQPISPSDSRTAVTDSNAVEANRSPSQHVSQQEPPALGQESHARMLLNLRGERGKLLTCQALYEPLITLTLVYIGEAAPISFLQFVRDTVAAQIGPSQFSHNDQSENMLENEPALTTSGVPTPGIIELDDEQRKSFIETYYAAVRLIAPISYA